MGTPREVAISMRRAWEMEPTSARIIEDIAALPRVIDKIIDAKGCVVPDEFLRTGRRARRADDSGDLKNNRRSRQQKATLTAAPIHPDHQDAYNFLLNKADGVLLVARIAEIVEENAVEAEDEIVENDIDQEIDAEIDEQNEETFENTDEFDEERHLLDNLHLN
jgi:hypothetical protein